MKNEFLRVAERIAKTASNGDITAKDIESIIFSEVNDKVNCYPGSSNTGCHEVAFFVSLDGKMKSGRNHDSFTASLHRLVQHLQGSCSGITQHAVLITDTWWAMSYEDWRSNIETIKKNGIKLEAYLISYSENASPIKI